MPAMMVDDVILKLAAEVLEEQVEDKPLYS